MPTRPVRLTRIEKLTPSHWGFVLHPTKGWRKPSVRSAHAQSVTAEIRAGMRLWSSHAFADVLRSEGLI